MWLTRFLDIISRDTPANPLSGIEDAVAKLNPDKIYVENVRSVLGVSYPAAVKICETAVRQGLFNRGIEVLCPDGSVAVSAPTENELPPTVHCWTQEGGNYEEITLATDALRKVAFYKLNDESSATLLHA